MAVRTPDLVTGWGRLLGGAVRLRMPSAVDFGGVEHTDGRVVVGVVVPVHELAGPGAGLADRDEPFRVLGPVLRARLRRGVLPLVLAMAALVAAVGCSNDTTIQAGVLSLLEELQSRLDLAYLFIAHDMSVIRHGSDQVAVMYLGRIVELGSRTDVFERASHPYTQALMSAMPVPDPVKERARQRIVLSDDVPSPIDPPGGCRFRTRCWKAQGICETDVPALVDRGQGHPVPCHFADDGGTGPPIPGPPDQRR